MKVNLTWNVCRICLYESTELQSIYETDEQNQLISDKIALCGGILIDKDMNLPHLICRKCVAFLSVAYKFHVNCQNSDKLLRAFVLDLNSEENFSKSFNEYVAQESAKTKPHESYLKVEAAGSTEHVEEYLIDIDENSLPEIKENILVNDEQEKVQAEDVGTDDWFAAENSFSSESELQKSPKKKKKPTRRKYSKRKPTNTITLGLDGSAVIKPVEETPLHICEVCGNKYTKKFALDNHMKWHRDEKPYACEICGKGFIINFQLTRHMRTHTGQKPYQCKFCGRKFSDLSTCIKHQRTHTNERPFKCETCGKAFNYSHVLKVHLAVHTGEKPYNCDLCGKAFSQLHHLKAHLNTLIHQSNPSPPQPNQQSKSQQKKPARRRKNQTEENTNLQSIIAMLDNEQDSIKVDSD